MDTRHKDRDWTLPTKANGRLESWEYVSIAVLMDIRDELKKLNTLLHCGNFTGLPWDIKKIRQRVCRRKRRA